MSLYQPPTANRQPPTALARCTRSSSSRATPSLRSRWRGATSSRGRRVAHSVTHSLSHSLTQSLALSVTQSLIPSPELLSSRSRVCWLASVAVPRPSPSQGADLLTKRNITLFQVRAHVPTSRGSGCECACARALVRTHVPVCVCDGALLRFCGCAAVLLRDCHRRNRPPQPFSVLIRLSAQALAGFNDTIKHLVYNRRCLFTHPYF
jgi:hypothetical protein